MAISRSTSISSEAELLHSYGGPINAVVVGAGGGIGAAVVELLDHCPNVETIFSVSRRPLPEGQKITSLVVDIEAEETIEAAAKVVKAEVGTVHLVFVATGILHDGDQGPEKTFRSLSSDWAARVFAINATGPMLVAKHFVPLMPRDEKAVFAAISAKVGSITDNGLGGWYTYRASKAALNQLIRTLSIEVARKYSDAVCLALHPGTVDTRLSGPFQGGVPDERLFTPEYAANRLLQVIDQADATDSGRLVAWDGEILPY